MTPICAAMPRPAGELPLLHGLQDRGAGRQLHRGADCHPVQPLRRQEHPQVWADHMHPHYYYFHIYITDSSLALLGSTGWLAACPAATPAAVTRTSSPPLAAWRPRPCPRPQRRSRPDHCCRCGISKA